MDRETDAPEGEPVAAEGEPVAGSARLRDRLAPDVLLTVAIGGAAGGVARAAIMRGLPAAPGRFPWSVLIINVAGAALIGALLATPAFLRPGRTRLRALATTGFCGGFTTWSTLMVATDGLLARGRPGLALSFLLASVVAGVAAAVGGAALVEFVVERVGDPVSRRRAAGR